MKHLRGYIFTSAGASPFEMDVTDAAQAHHLLALAGAKHYMFLIEREVEEDE